MNQMLLKAWQEAAQRGGPLVKKAADRALQVVLTQARQARLVLDVRVCVDLPGVEDDPGLRLRVGIRPGPSWLAPQVEAPRMELLTELQRKELRTDSE